MPLDDARVVWKGSLSGPGPAGRPIEARVVVGLRDSRGAYEVEILDADAMGGTRWVPLSEHHEEHRQIVATVLAEIPVPKGCR